MALTGDADPRPILQEVERRATDLERRIQALELKTVAEPVAAGPPWSGHSDTVGQTYGRMNLFMYRERLHTVCRRRVRATYAKHIPGGAL